MLKMISWLMFYCKDFNSESLQHGDFNELFLHGFMVFVSKKIFVNKKKSLFTKMLLKLYTNE